MVCLRKQEADIANDATVAASLAAHRPTIVVNAAAYNQVDKAEADRAGAMRTNAAGPGVIAAACARAGVPMIHVSTDYVFDGTAGRPYRENDECNPLGAYGLSKALGEDAVRSACPEHLILRTAWLFGAFGDNFLKTVIRLAGERSELRMVGDQRGSPTSTEDLARAILVAAPAMARGDAPWGTYHVAGSGVASRYEFADHIVEAQAPFTGLRPKVVEVASSEFPTPARRPANSVLDSSRFADVFGFSARRWPTAVDATVAYLFKAEVSA